MAGGTERSAPSAGATTLLRDPRLISILLIAAIGPMSVMLVSPALPAMASALGVSDARIGLVMTAVTLPPMVLAPVLGIVSDLYGRRTVAFPALVAFGVAGVAIAFVDDFLLVLLLRGIQGLAMAGIAPIAVTLLGDIYTGPTGSTAQGLRASASGLAASLLPLVAGWLAGFSWNLPFLVFGSAFMVLAIGYTYLPETAAGTAEDRTLTTALSEYRESMRAELSDLSLVVVMSGGFVRFFSLFAFLTFVPIFAVRALGATAFEAGIVVAVRGIRIVVSPTAGFWVARFSRKGMLIGAVAVVFSTFALLPFAPGVVGLAALAALHTIGDGLLSPAINDTVTARVGDENRNGVVSATRSLKEAGKTASPVVLGVVLAAGDFRWVFFASAAVLAVYVVAVLAAVD